MKFTDISMPIAVEAIADLHRHAGEIFTTTALGDNELFRKVHAMFDGDGEDSGAYASVLGRWLYRNQRELGIRYLDEGDGASGSRWELDPIPMFMPLSAPWTT